jgi:hypothetical protein
VKPVADVADVLLFPGGRETSQCCQHCNQPGGVVQCHYGEASALLHRECVEAWRIGLRGGAGDGLDIPGFLDRRNVQ